MTTWEDFAAAGFSIERSPKAWPKLHGPNDPGRYSDLRFEIDSRLELVGDGVDFATWLPGRASRCAHCGDPTPTFRTCGLCELARAKALRLKQERRAA